MTQGGNGLRKVAHGFPEPLAEGRFLRRYKRFLADVEMEDGRVVTCHCPNSGSMRSCLEEGAPVRLSPAGNPNRRTPYTWEMIRLSGSEEDGGGWVGVNTIVPNILVAEAARLEAHPLFAGTVKVRREVPLDPGTRLDLLVETGAGPLYVEVKNVTLVEDGHARFPDSVTERGARHLSKLAGLAARPGVRAALVYVVQRGGARSFAPAWDIDPAYGEAALMAREAGVEAAVLTARVSPGGVRLWGELPFSSHPPRQT